MLHSPRPRVVLSALIATCLGLPACNSGSSFSPAASPVQRQKPSTAKRSTSPCPCLYVANLGNNTVTVYPIGATGSVEPIETIGGSNTELIAPVDVALDSNGNIYVANENGEFNDSVTVYAAGANGNVSPIRTIAGSNTAMNYVRGVALDSSEDVYVTNGSGGPSGSGSVTVYAAGANGNVAPIDTITGSNTGLVAPLALALDASNNTYVPNFNTATLTVYAAGANGNVAPIQTIGGGRTRIFDPFQVAVGGGSIYVANSAAYSITSYPVGANGNVKPRGDIHGRKTKLNDPSGVALDASGNVYAANANNTITVYAPGTVGNVSPIRTIKGARTKLSAPFRIAIQ